MSLRRLAAGNGKILQTAALCRLKTCYLYLYGGSRLLNSIMEKRRYSMSKGYLIFMCGCILFCAALTVVLL